MKKTLLTTTILAGALAAASFGTAQANELEVTANIGVASAYVFRGDVFGDDAQVSGGLDASYGMFYAGTWLSSQGDSTGEGEEVDIYAGISIPVGEISLDFGYIYYAFPGAQDAQFESGAGNVSEIYVGASFPFGLDTYIWFAPSGEDGTDDDEYVYFDINYGLDLTENTSVYFHYGYIQGLGDANDDDSNAEKSVSDFAVGLAVDDFFIQASYSDNYTEGNDIEPQYIVGWGTEFAVKY